MGHNPKKYKFIDTFCGYSHISFYTLSFAEYLLFQKVRTGKESENIRKDFSLFLRSGGFPVLHVSDYTEETAGRVVYDIYSSIRYAKYVTIIKSMLSHLMKYGMIILKAFNTCTLLIFC